MAENVVEAEVHSEPEESSSPEIRVPIWVRWLPVAVLIIAHMIHAWNRRWITDDGYINMRVIQEMYAGRGPVFNPGERVELGTSTLWLYMVAIASVFDPANSGMVAIGLGLICTLAALIFAVLGARELSVMRGGEASWFAVPVGLVLVAAIEQFADFSTSGLENPLSFLWLAVCFYGVARTIRTKPEGGAPIWIAVVVGLGWLVRPDMALYTVAFGVVLLIVTKKNRIRAIVAAAIIPLAYQIFRMGFYANLFPNTALAKNAGDALWEFGFNYLYMFAAMYALPFVLVVVAILVMESTVWRSFAQRDVRVLLYATVIVAILHATYIVRVGGDFMFGRFLLTPLFALLLPFSVVFLDFKQLSRLTMAGFAVLMVWTLLVNSNLRADRVLGHGVDNEHASYTDMVPSHKTWRPADWMGQDFYETGRRAADDVAAGKRIYREGDMEYPIAPGYVYAMKYEVMGIVPLTAGADVVLADNLALADPIAARMEPDPEYIPERLGHVGHPKAWRVARYAAPSVMDTDEDRLARETLQCGQMKQLNSAISEPLTPGRFLHNIVLSPSLTAMKIPFDVKDAHKKFCQ